MASDSHNILPTGHLRNNGHVWHNIDFWHNRNNTVCSLHLPNCQFPPSNRLSKCESLLLMAQCMRRIGSEQTFLGSFIQGSLGSVQGCPEVRNVAMLTTLVASLSDCSSLKWETALMLSHQNRVQEGLQFAGRRCISFTHRKLIGTLLEPNVAGPGVPGCVYSKQWT